MSSICDSRSLENPDSHYELDYLPRNLHVLSETLRHRILEFRKEREWKQFHTLRTLSTSIVLEAAELAEITQWTPDAELTQIAVSQRLQIEAEMADILILMSYLAEDLGIDIEKAVDAKLLDNAKRYPVEKCRGRSSKYDQL